VGVDADIARHLMSSVALSRERRCEHRVTCRAQWFAHLTPTPRAVHRAVDEDERRHRAQRSPPHDEFEEIARCRVAPVAAAKLLAGRGIVVQDDAVDVAAAGRDRVIPNDSLPADLVLEGGGVKGIALAGAVLTLDEAGYVFKRVAGTSAGAVVAAVVAALDRAGRPLSAAREYVDAIDYSRFAEKRGLRAALGMLGDVEHLVVDLGLHDGDYLVEWLGAVLRDIGVTTFGDLALDDPGADANLRPEQQFSLVVHTSDITRGKCVRLPWDYHEYGLEPARQPIVGAVRASMSIPFFFEPVRVRVRSPGSRSKRIATWVDGGLLANFPVEVFDRTDGIPGRWPTIGVKLSAGEAAAAPWREVDGLFEEALACLHTLLENADRFYVTPDRAARTIFVDSAGVDGADFGIGPAERARLFDNGAEAVRTWLARGKHAIPSS
jgi:NTE family protein